MFQNWPPKCHPQFSQKCLNETRVIILLNTGRFIMFCVITNVYNKKTKGPALMELFTATGTDFFFVCDN
jgi:hypothetical protein